MTHRARNTVLILIGAALLVGAFVQISLGRPARSGSADPSATIAPSSSPMAAAPTARPAPSGSGPTTPPSGATPRVGSPPPSSQTPSATPTESLGRTLYLAPDGDDESAGTIDAPWLTLGHAEQRLRPGDTLIVRGGRYLGQTTNWETAGSADRPITVAAAEGETPIFDGERSTEPFLWIRADAGWLVFRGLTVTNYKPDETGVWILTGGAHDVVIEGVTMSGNVGPEQLDHLIYLADDHVRDVVIRDSLLEGMSGACVHMYHEPNARGVVIERNTFRDCHWGVLVWSGAAEVLIRHNTFLDNDIGIDLGKSSAVTVADNLVIGNVGLVVHDLDHSPGLAENHNLWWGGSRPLQTDARRYTLRTWAAATGLGSGSISVDPRIVSRDDPRLGDGSPAVGAAGDGTNIGRY